MLLGGDAHDGTPAARVKIYPFVPAANLLNVSVADA